jgi:hypothetical protein
MLKILVVVWTVLQLVVKIVHWEYLIVYLI